MPPGLTAGASLSDILSTAQNIVTALNGFRTAFDAFRNGVVPTVSTGQLSASTLVRYGRTRLLGVSMIGGAAVSLLHDTATIAGAGAGNKVYEISATHGFYPVNMVFNNGLVFVPGASALVALFYSEE